MRKFLLAAAMSLAATTAFAADMTKAFPVKAPPAYPATKCGMYLGINGEGTAASVNGAPPGTISTGGTIGGLAGYACPTATFPWFVEAIADWQNIGTSNGPLSLNAPFHGEVRGGVQTDFLQLIPQILPGTGTPASLPTATPPVLPPGATADGPAVNYVYGALDFDDVSAQFMAASAHDWTISPEIGTGMLVPVKLANGKPVVLDAWVGAELETNAICIGQFTCPKFATRWKAGTAVKF